MSTGLDARFEKLPVTTYARPRKRAGDAAHGEHPAHGEPAEHSEPAADRERGEHPEPTAHRERGEHPEPAEHGELRVIEAKTHRSRRRGLSRLDALPADHALLIPATPSVHTFGMRFALDLIWLDKSGTTIRVDRDVGPRRMRYCRGARAVIECNGGHADAFIAAGVGGGANSPGAPAPS